MTIPRQWLAISVALVLAATGVFAASALIGDQLRAVSVGSKAPDFRAAPMTDTVQKTLADYRGDVVLVNIWATWCGPCRVEMPSIQKLHESFGPRGLKIIAVSIDEPGHTEAIREFTRDFKLTFEVLHDRTSAIRDDYQTVGVPETFVIGRDGVIRKRWTGPANWNSASNRALIEQLLAEKVS